MKMCGCHSGLTMKKTGLNSILRLNVQWLLPILSSAKCNLQGKLLLLLLPLLLLLLLLLL